MNDFTPIKAALQRPLRPAPAGDTDAASVAGYPEAEAALARFRERWPAERCRDLWAATCGTPAEREAVEARILARAVIGTATAEPPADEAVRSLLPGLLSDEELEVMAKRHRERRR